VIQLPEIFCTQTHLAAAQFEMLASSKLSAAAAARGRTTTGGRSALVSIIANGFRTMCFVLCLAIVTYVLMTVTSQHFANRFADRRSFSIRLRSRLNRTLGGFQLLRGELFVSTCAGEDKKCHREANFALIFSDFFDSSNIGSPPWTALM